MFSGSRRKVFGVDKKVFGERIAAYLRALYPQKTAANVAVDTGSSVAQVEKWLGGDVCPNGAAILRMICAYGPDFIKSALGDQCPAWLDAAHNAAEDARRENQISVLREQLRQLGAP